LGVGLESAFNLDGFIQENGTGQFTTWRGAPGTGFENYGSTDTTLAVKSERIQFGLYLQREL
jgi:hypothetical protein